MSRGWAEKKGFGSAGIPAERAHDTLVSKDADSPEVLAWVVTMDKNEVRVMFCIGKFNRGHTLLEVVRGSQ